MILECFRKENIWFRIVDQVVYYTPPVYISTAYDMLFIWNYKWKSNYELLVYQYKNYLHICKIEKKII